MRPTRWILLLFVMALLSPGLAAAGVVGDHLLIRISEVRPDEPIPVIIHMADRLDPSVFRRAHPSDKGRRRTAMIVAMRSHANRSQTQLRRFLAREGAGRAKVLWLVNAYAAEVPPGMVERLAELPGVERVILDREIRQSGALADGTAAVTASLITAAAEWNIDRVGAPDLWALGFEGTGMVVATMDSGVDNAHQDLSTRYRGGSNSWYDPSGEHATPYDTTGHGTSTMGILVGGEGGGTVIGVAPAAQWIAVKIFNDAGSASFSAIHDGYQWLLDPDGNAGTDDAPDVINNSWGLADQVDVCILEFQPDIQSLKEAGILVVFSAGNAGSSSSTSLSPANNPEGYAVGAVNVSDVVSFGSSRGPSDCDGTIFPEVVAPGVDIYTSTLTFGGLFPDSYSLESGTSFAAPHVTGVMALLAQAYPLATVADIESAVIDGALDLGTAGPDHDYGNGLINAQAAYDLLSGSGGCVDGDGDLRYVGAGCAQAFDCNDADNQIWSIPGEVPSLMFLDAQTLGWNVPPESGGSAGSLRYDTIRSDNPADFMTAAVCVESNGPGDESSVDPDLPPLSQTYYYLVRAENNCPGGSGSLGAGSDLVERTGTECP